MEKTLNMKLDIKIKVDEEGLDYKVSQSCVEEIGHYIYEVIHQYTQEDLQDKLKDTTLWDEEETPFTFEVDTFAMWQMEEE